VAVERSFDWLTDSIYKNVMPTLVQPLSSNATVSEDIDGMRIVIPGRWNWGLLFASFWLCGWTVGGITAGRSLLHKPNPFLFFWMLGWAFGESLVGYTVLYALAGKQVIVANPDALSCRTEIFGLGVSKSYLPREIKNLRFQPRLGTGRGQVASGIAFDYGSRTIRCGAGLEEAEATELISRIRQRCGIAALAATAGSGTKFWGQ
jgi:hypothetical protein